MAENKHLAWIKRYRKILSVRALEDYLGIPCESLARYTATGKFPRIHIAKVDQGMSELLSPDSGTLGSYAADLIAEYIRRRVDLDNIHAIDKPRIISENNKLDQMGDDIMRLYIALYRSHPVIAAFIFEQMVVFIPVLIRTLRGVLDSERGPRSVLEALLNSPAQWQKQEELR